MRNPVPGALGYCSRNAKVSHPRVLAAKQDVFRLYISVKDSPVMSVSESFSYIRDYPYSVLQREAFVAIKARTQGLTLNVWHYIVEKASRLTGVQQRKYVGMVQTSRVLDFAKKTLSSSSNSKLASKNLQRDWSMVLDIVSEINRGHATVTDSALQAIATGQLLTKKVDF
jgi:hypothetical protein